MSVRKPLFRHIIRRVFRSKSHLTMEATKNKKQEPRKDEHGAILLPEQMERAKPATGNRPQSTVGSKTPGKEGRKDMSEAAERKARRIGIKEESKK